MNVLPPRRFPVTLSIALVALASQWTPAFASWLQLDFALVAEGQWWRIWTGHLTHYDGDHLFWDLLMFVVLGAACESRLAEKQRAWKYPVALCVMATVISAGIGLFCDGIATYRGLSGIDTGLFVWFVTEEARRSWSAGDRRATMLWLMPCLALIGKLLFEAGTGLTLFVDSSGFTPLVESHLAGAAVGLLLTGLGSINSWASAKNPVVANHAAASGPAQVGPASHCS